MNTVNVLIADDHAVVRTGLKQILAELHPVRVVEAASGAEALRLARQEHFDVLLLDIQLGDRSGLDVLKEIKAERPTLPVLLLSMYSEHQYGVQGLRGGASGYLTKESAPEQLVIAVRRALEGKRYISEGLAEKLAERLGDDAIKMAHELLSNRELEILRMIASGKSPTQMADALHLSKKTISTHRDRLLRKMKLRNNAELTRYAIEHHLVG
jgi:DNA-binding NarL/FixJ family response regulator